MSLIERAFTENLHPRGTGAAGGQFVAAGSGATAAKKAPAGRPRAARTSKRPAGNLAFDGRRGPGYGQKNGDKRVKNLQTALNRLGLTDSSGKRLAVDGKLGPKTTAAIKKAQRKLGLKADGVVTPALLAKLTKAKKLEKAKPVKKAMPAKKAAPTHTATPAPRRRGRGGEKAAPRTVQVGRSLGYSQRMTDLERHGTHNQKSHGNRLGKPTNIAGKTGLAKATAALADKPELGPARPPKARSLDTYAARRDAMREHKKLTRSEFDALPEAEKQTILSELDRIAASGDKHTGRDGMGIQIRGDSQHVMDAKHYKWMFTRKIQAAPDDSASGRSARLLAATSPSEARAALYGATKKDMDAIAEANGWLGGTSLSWKVEKWREHLVKKATGG